MTISQRIMKLLMAPPATLARIDAILDGTDTTPKKHEEDTRLITYTEAARRLCLSRPTIYRLVKLGRLDVAPLDGVNRIRLQSVFDFANGLRA